MLDPMRERLYRLLPSIYRQRDTEQGYALRALIHALESEFQLLEADIDKLYDNWFIETADEWVVPYIGDLLGVFDFSETKNLFFSQRRRVANTIAYRRRKGLPTTLEHIAQDVTGWPSRVVEYMQFLASTQHLSHIRPRKGTCIDLRQSTALARLGGPFDTAAHTVDVRHVGTGSAPGIQNYAPHLIRGKYHVESLGLFMWRLQSYQIVNATAARISKETAHGQPMPPGCFTFDPLQRDTQLFSLPHEMALLERTGLDNVPAPISRAEFANDLQEYATLFAEKPPADSFYYGPSRSLYIVLNGKPVPPGAVMSADLSSWQVPQHPDPQQKKLAAIDTTLGRIVVLNDQHTEQREAASVEVTYCYGFSGEIGGGPYIRQLPPTEAYVITIKKGYDTIIDLNNGSTTATLQEALTLWEQYCKTTNRPRCTIRILDNGTYSERYATITLPESSRLVIEAAHNLRPTINLVGNLNIRSAGESAHLMFNGLSLRGRLRLGGNLQFDVAHCTLMPYGIEVQRETPRATEFQITVQSSITGPLRLSRGKGTLRVQDSIVDGLSEVAIDTLAPEERAGFVSTLEGVTVFGRVQLRELELAREVIFTDPLYVQRRQSGQVRFSYVPPSSQTPRRDHCQPSVGQHQDSSENGMTPDEDTEQLESAQIYPVFTSARYSDAGYAQLSEQCAPQIRRGGEDGAEMGVFHTLRNIQRQDNLYHILDEYFPFNMAVNIFYVT